MIGYMLAHEQFPVAELVQIGQAAAAGGFDLLATSDHFQPWQADEGHVGQAWVTLAALGNRSGGTWMGTAVTCPTFRYNPAVVAEAFASLSQLYPGRIFLGLGSGEALNEQATTGMWPGWQERWDRLIEAIGIIRELWSGRPVKHQGHYYTINARLYDPPAQPIPLLTAANGQKSMRLAGQHGDGLITDLMTWKRFKSEWESGAKDAGKSPADMPVLIEQYVVVGNEDDAKRAAELWRFDPGIIQQRAEADVPIYAKWPVGTDPDTHIKKITELFDSGATIVNIHSGQPDQKAVVEFYARNVIPAISRRG
jgi:TAT-translocated FGD2 family F420-dependent dehydrogenase